MTQRLTNLLVAVILIAFAGCSNDLNSVNELPESPGEIASSFQSFTEMAESGISMAKAAQAIPEKATIHSNASGSGFYFDRQAFENAFNGRLAHEDFSGSNFPFASVGGCAGAINQATGGYGCYPERREILRNIHVDNNHGNNDPIGMAVLTEGFIGLPSTVVGANAFSDHTQVNFYTDGVHAAGFDLIDPFGDSGFTVIVFQSGEYISSTPVSPGFVGFITHERSILQVLVVSNYGTGAELIDNFTYDGIDTRP